MYKSQIEGRVGDRLHRLEAGGVISTFHRQVRVTANRGWRCDFVVELPSGDVIWIEVDGLGAGRAEGAYDENHPKIKHYRRKKLNFAVVRTPAQAEKVVRDGARGLVTSPRESPRNIIQLGDNRHTDDEIVREVRRVGRKLGRAPTTAEFIKWGRISPQTVSRRVGWNQALLRAGYLPRRNVSKEVLLNELRRVISELGRAPSRAEFDARSPLTALMLTRRFGEWTAAVRAAGAEPVYERCVWTNKRVVAELRALNKRLPRLTHAQLKASGHVSLYYASQRLFGSFKQALTAAGIDPRSRMVGWSRRFDACVSCGTTKNRHASKGRCVRCYEREHRALRRDAG